MKKMMIFAIAALGLTMAACNGKKAEQPQTACLLYTSDAADE